MTMNKIYGKLRAHNKKNYVMLIFCIILSVLLVTSYGLIYFSPTVQIILPDGGDSSKMADMVFAAAILGCGIFTIYASSLFYRYKSREMGIFMALGTPRAKLRKVLFIDILTAALGSCVVGMLLAVPLARGIWGMFQRMIIDTKDMKYQMGWTGLLIGAVFSIFVCVSIFIMAVRFLRRTNIIEVLNDSRISEPVKDVKGWYLPCGIILTAAGFLIAYYGLSVTEKLFGYRIYSVWNVFYLLCCVGVYMLMVYIVVHAKRGRHPERYYKNIISTSMMRFMGRQTVRNMCVIVLLVFGGLFTVNYVPVMWTGNQETVKNMEKDFMFTYPAEEKQITKDEIAALADEYKVSLKDYYEMTAVTLITDGMMEKEGKNGKVIDEYVKELQGSVFYRASDIEELTGEQTEVKPGEYKRIFRQKTGGEIEENDLLVTDPVTREERTYHYGGGVTLGNSLLMSMEDGVILTLNDDDFDSYLSHLEPEYEYRTVAFDVGKWEESYAFASQLKSEIIDRTPKEYAVSWAYDWFEERRCMEEGESYWLEQSYPRGEGSLDLSSDNSQLGFTWKYYPDFKILKDQDLMKNMAVMLMLFVYIAVICLAAVGIIAYTRGVSIAMNYRQVFVDLRRLGANRKYMLFCIRGQLVKVFFYPYLVGLILNIFYIMMIFSANDGGIRLAEWKSIGIDAVIYVVISVYLYLVYHAASSKFQKIVGVKEEI